MTTSTILEVKNLGKTFERKISLSSLSFSVKKGEKIAIIGPSGAGKTTLFNLLTGIVSPYEGTILIDGQALDYWQRKKQLANKVGVIRQQFDLVESLPVIQNVLVGRLKDWGFFKSLWSFVFPQDKQVAYQALKRVGIEDKIYVRTSSLSGGEQQRVALARLLVQSPEIVLADEPVSSLDPARAEDVIKMLTKLADEDNQTLITTLHSVEFATKYFTRMIALKNGHLFFDLPSDEVTPSLLEDLYRLKEFNQDE
ncbi:phosphonate ABC transporter ATP-binding protein [Neobacillus sp. D3-1R]|uniref:phosphonate ABC transporter ATP-binding protein n=1 Tax=Neobacillus sp. D3-1R TaxID=3445778 RepID=UPI003FA0C9E4